MTSNKPDQPPHADKPETLAERSARLEAEAASMAAKDAAQHYAQHDSDPLAPEPHPEDEPQSHASEAEDGPEATLGTEQTKAIIQSLQNELESAREQVARAMAEAENTRRRARKDSEDAGKFAITKFARDILEISDTLTRAIEASPKEAAEHDQQVKAFIDGVEATQRILLKSFEKHGIQKIEPLDEPFNPNFHEVMFEAPVPGKPAGIVMQVLEPGYIINERLLRAAKVGVTKEDPSAPASSSTHSGGTIDTEA